MKGHDGKEGEDPRNAPSKEESGKRDKIKKDVTKKKGLIYISNNIICLLNLFYLAFHFSIFIVYLKFILFTILIIIFIFLFILNNLF